MQSTGYDIQYIGKLLATGRSEEDDSTLVSLHSIEIAPINCEILKQVEGSRRKGNMHMKLGVNDKRQPLSHQ